MRRLARSGLAVFALLLSLLIVPTVGAAPGDGNSDAAKLCQDGGYADYVRTDGTTFNNTGDCVSYAAQGGVLKPKPTLTVTFPEAGQVIIAGTGLVPGSRIIAQFDNFATRPVPGVVDSAGNFLYNGDLLCSATNLIVTAERSTGGTISVGPVSNPHCP